MPFAVQVTEKLRGKAGEAYGFKLSEPYSGVDYLIVSRIDLPAFGLRETRIVPAELSHGEVIMLTTGDNTMAASIPLELCSHEDALASIGFAVTEEASEPSSDSGAGDPVE
ncbi:hypothetical protein [Rhodococcoides fascians]|uniref:hypothetical protein n=1 Tax=Rhodococcoides fascians TaxID=1828 RepID=UPI0018AF5852|nr:hypothetical protein [Rhodococcus fascians]